MLLKMYYYFLMTSEEEKELTKLKRSLGQKLRHNKKVWGIFIQAYEQCLKEGYEFPFGEETVKEWRLPSTTKIESKKEFEKDLDRNKYSFGTFNNFYLCKTNHPTKMFEKGKSEKQYFDTQKRFWTLTNEFVKKLEEEKKIEEDKKHPTLSEEEVNRIKYHLQKKGSFRYFLTDAKEAWLKKTGGNYNSFYKFHIIPYDKKFWDFAKEFEKTFDFEKYKKYTKDYQKEYFQKNKEEIYKQRKILGYSENIHEQWNKANARYRNKVCLYQGNYYYLEQLRRKIGKTEDIKQYILSDSDQNRKCLYNGQTFEFWQLCYELRKQKIKDSYSIALKSIKE